MTKETNEYIKTIRHIMALSLDTMTDEEINNCEEIIKLIKEQPRWIPCSERMPEIRYDKCGNVSSDLVIIWCEQDSEGGIYEWYDIGFFQPATECFQTISEEGYFLTICHISKVKAWMPLPEPYESND